MEDKEITNLFSKLLININKAQNDNHYSEKEQLNTIEIKVKKWYESYKETYSLKNIKIEDLNFIDREITDLFDKYISLESIENNYIEIMLYNFGLLEKYWKDEMLGDDIQNV